MAKAMPPESAKIDVEAIKKSILGLESPKAKRERERVVLFSELYQAIRDQLQTGVSKTAIIKSLADHDVSIGNLVFDDLLEAEAKRRGEPVPGKEGDVPAKEMSDDESTVARQAELTKQDIE